MKYRFYTISKAICLLLLMIGFKTTLSAQTSDINKGCSPLLVNFTAPAGAGSWFWDFKDGGTSVLQNPSNIFTTPGTYTVEFRNTPNGVILGSITITVWPKIDVQIAATPVSGCIPLNVQFTDNSVFNNGIQILGRSWVFGDGGSANNIPNPAHLYSTAGNFTVSLELTTNYPSCNITDLFPNIVTTLDAPTTAFTTFPATPQACNPPLTVAFNNTTTGTGALTYNWDFGNGNTSTLQNPPAQTYTQSGIFPVRLIATNALGCVDSFIRNVVIGSPTPSFDMPDTVCINEKISIINTSPSGFYAWYFGTNAIPVSSSQVNPVTRFTTGGPQTITLTVTAAGGCTGTITRTIFVDTPDATFTLSPNYSCGDPAIFNLSATSPAATAWNWYLPYQTNVTGVKNYTYMWTNPDTTGYNSLGEFMDSIFLVVTNPSGCRDTSGQKITVWRPNARFLPARQHGCAPLTVDFEDRSFSNEPITQWTWLFDDGTSNLVQGTGNTTHTFTQPGEYEVRLIIRNSAGCIDTSYIVLIEVGVPITGNFTAAPLEICPGGVVQFTNLTTDPRVDAWHFYSDNDQSWHCAQNQNPEWAHNSQAGPLDVSLMVEYNGCFNTVTKNDYINLKGPIARLHYATNCDSSMFFHFVDESSGATQLHWSLGDGDSSVLSQFIHQYDVSGAYQVILTAENASSGCPASRDTATVYPTQIQSAFTLPYYICANKEYILNGSQAVDVNASCYKGYTWYFSFQRPIRTSDEQIPFSFGVNGPQKVWLAVEDINGCMDTIGQDIKVFDQYPNFEMSDSLICLPGTVQFSDMSTADTTLTRWQWNFGDGSPLAYGQQVSHTFTQLPAGGIDTFHVVLTITDTLGCSNIQERSIAIYKPVSSLSLIPSPNICTGQPITVSGTQFTGGGSGLTWDWTFGDTSTANGQTVSHAYQQAGIYIVKMTYTEIGSGCKGASITQINVQSYPQASFVSNVDSLSIICYPQNTLLTNTSTSAYPVSVIWDLGNGQFSTGNNAATVFPKGTYTINMIATTAFGCADTASRSFTVVGPEGNFAMDKNKICLGDSILFTLKDTVDISSFSWSFGDGTTADNINPVTHAYTFLPPSGATLAKLVLRGEDDACSFTIDLPINFSQVDAKFITAQDPACLGQEHVFVNNSVESDLAQWTFGDGTNSTAQNPTHEYDAEGPYTVTLIVTDQPLGCMDTVVQTVSVAGLPNFEAYGGIVCPGDTLTIGVTTPVPGATYTWTPGTSVLNPKQQPSVQVVPAATTIYTVSVVVDSTGCMDSDTALVVVPLVYTGAGSLDTLVDQGQPVLLPVVADPLFNFQWQPNDPGTPPLVTPTDSTLRYTLTVSDKFGCSEALFSFIVRIFPQEFVLPNAFTPDNDGTNDGFRLIPDTEETGLITVDYLRIYNRWGQKIFEGQGTDATVVWDGKVDGAEAPVDVYIWQVGVTYVTGRKAVRTGELTLIR